MTGKRVVFAPRSSSLSAFPSSSLRHAISASSYFGEQINELSVYMQILFALRVLPQRKSCEILVIKTSE